MTIPLPIKVAYSLFCAILVPVYLTHYGPTNFLYFCDEALLLTLAGVWLESALLVSMAAVGILVPQIVWVADFSATALGHPLIGMTSYMFDAQKPAYLRALSSFHGWLPLLLIYLVSRLGYDRRALPLWSVVALISIAVSYLWMPPPRPDAGLTPVNIDYVWGMSDIQRQTMMPATAWLAVLCSGLFALIYLPTHAVLSRIFDVRRAGSLLRASVPSPRP